MPTYGSVSVTYEKRIPGVCNVHQHFSLISHTSAYVSAIRCSVTALIIYEQSASVPVDPFTYTDCFQEHALAILCFGSVFLFFNKIKIEDLRSARICLHMDAFSDTIVLMAL